MEGRRRGILPILGIATVVMVALVVGWPALVGAQPLTPIPHPIGAPDPATGAARSRTVPPASGWQSLTNRATLFNGASNPILLTDGTVLVKDTGLRDWSRLTPDETGSYVNGTWSPVASLPVGYSPLYHASAVLPRRGRSTIPSSTPGRRSSLRRSSRASEDLSRRRSATPRASCWQTERTCRPIAVRRRPLCSMPRR